MRKVPTLVSRASVCFDEAGVTFRYKDYRRDGGQRPRVMTLATDEFIRRLLLHVLPRRFHRIRHYGLLAASARKASLARARELLTVAPPPDDERRKSRAISLALSMLRRTHDCRRDLRPLESAAGAPHRPDPTGRSPVTRHGPNHASAAATPQRRPADVALDLAGVAPMLAIGVPRSAQNQHTAHRQRNEARSWTGCSHHCAGSCISQDPKSP